MEKRHISVALPNNAEKGWIHGTIALLCAAEWIDRTATELRLLTKAAGHSRAFRGQGCLYSYGLYSYGTAMPVSRSTMPNGCAAAPRFSITTVTSRRGGGGGASGGAVA